MRTKLGALLGAGGLLMLAASVTVAAPPTYSINVSKTANPAAVGEAGGTVTFTVWVTATGTGFFQTVTVDDPLAGCTIGPKVETSGDGDDKLETGETWTYSCTVDNVTVGTQNTATVNACHDISACNQAAHDAQGQGAVTVQDDGSTVPPVTEPPVTEPPVTEPPVTEPPVTEPPVTDAPPSTPESTPDPTLDNAGLTQAPTDTDAGATKPMGSQRTIMLVLALGMLLASLILVTPPRPARQRVKSR
jgi:hypothetical protein